MPSSTVLSLAILKVNWDATQRSYLDNFVPIIAECIRLSSNDVVSVSDLQQDLLNRFGLQLPQNSIRSLLRRVSRKRYIAFKDRMYVRNPKQLARLNFHEVQQRVLVMHEALIDKLVTFCRDKHGIEWSGEDAETALQSYLEDNQLVIISAMGSGTLIPATRDQGRSAKYIVGSFVQHLQDTHAAALDHLDTIAKGHMLANAIFVPDLGRVQRKFRETEVYLDTAFLMHSLGYSGRARSESCTELLQLLYETGASLRCFNHTLDEIRGILQACAGAIGQGKIRDSRGSSIEHFLSCGYTASDIELLSVRLEDDLQALQIRVVDKPSYETHKHVIGEEGLSGVLDEAIGYVNPRALHRDVDSISAIARLRKGEEFFAVERCRALFITTNTALARSSRQFFYEDSSYTNAIPPCLTDYAITNLLWLKKPLKAPDLPRKRIIADCYAATQPSEHLWGRYLAEIDKLEKSGRVTSDEYVVLRCSLVARSTLMDITLGEEDAFTQGTAQEIIEQVKVRMQADLRSALADEMSARRTVEEELRTVAIEKLARVARIESRAQRYASIIAKALEVLALILLLVGTITAFPWAFPSVITSWVRYLIASIQAILLILSVANLMYGTQLNTYVQKFEEMLSEFISEKLFEILE